MEKEFKNTWDEYLASNEYKEYLDATIKYQAEYELAAKDFFNSLEYDQRLLVVYHTIKMLHENEYTDHGSYRHLIYTKLGFSTDAYSTLMDAGLMYIHNDIYLYEDIVESIRAIFKYLNIDYTNKMVMDAYSIFCYGQLNSSYSQLKFDFEEE